MIALFALVLTLWQLSSIGPGIAAPEKASAIAAATWHWNWQQWQTTDLPIVNLPYLFLQKISIAGLGLSTLSIRLPSAIIGLTTCGVFILLMQRLYKPHVAVVASAILVASSWFIGIARFGTAYIMIPFVWTLATYSFVRLIRLDKLGFAWAALAALAAGLALYTPYGIYALATGVVLVLMHPTARRAVTGLTGPQVVLGLFIFIPMLVPLGWGLYKDPSQAWLLFGLSSQLPTVHQFITNLSETLKALVWRAPELPELRLANLPVLGIGTIALMVAGIYRCIRDWRAMRTQFVLVNILLIVLIVSLNPYNKNYAVLIMPIYLLVATGVTVLFREWYKLFPRNPYARSFALVPIIIFLGLLVSYSYQRYFIAWARTDQTYQVYPNDLDLARRQMSAHPSVTLVVPTSDLQWYQLLARQYPAATVAPIQPTPAPEAILLSGALPLQPAATQTVAPIVNDYQNQALRFWLITPGQ